MFQILSFQVQNTVLLPLVPSDLGERAAMQTLLIRDTAGRVYVYPVGRGRDELGAADQYLLCVQPGERITVRVHVAKSGPLNTEVQRRILAVELPEVFRRLGVDEQGD